MKHVVAALWNVWFLIPLFFALLLYLLLVTQDSVQGQITVPPLQRSSYDDRLTTLDRLAVEDAYRTQVTHLFLTWMKDSHGQPHRALAGTRQARKAYIESMTELDKREQKP